MDELWLKFVNEHPSIADKYCNEKRTFECPNISRDYATLEMVKATSASCLCGDCEGMDVLRRGTTGACTIIENVLRYFDDNERSNNCSVSRDINS